MRIYQLAICCLALLSACTTQKKQNSKINKTYFQTSSDWRPEIDINSDVVMVYGNTNNYQIKAKTWKDRGYETHSMFSASWGENKDLLNGDFDGQPHPEIIQKTKNGEDVLHGAHIPYFIPNKAYTNYFKSFIKTALDAGTKGFYIEEPEIFTRGGYSEAFKSEWNHFFNQPWQDQHSSPENMLRTGILKTQLYKKHIEELYKYAKNLNPDIKCYVPTHSILNYSLWNIISPEIEFNKIESIDGYIGQVWTGTARTPIYYKGKYAERTFENAFLEYTSLLALTDQNSKEMIFLTDPIEDDPNHTWTDYRENYQKNFVAQLLFPQVNQYEVMPWPSRIFDAKYPSESGGKTVMPKDYATQVLIEVNSLNHFEKSDELVNGTKGITVAISNTIQFQTPWKKDNYSDPRIANFYGMALPLVKHGVPAKVKFIENMVNSEALDDTELLLLSYENLKPLSKEYHKTIANWVNNGGSLIYFGTNKDVFNNSNQWWNKEGFSSPLEHLLKDLNAEDTYENQQLGKGQFLYIKKNPKDFILEDNDAEIIQIVKNVWNSKKRKSEWHEKNHFDLQRDAYRIIYTMTESVDSTPLKIRGHYIDLFSSKLEIIESRDLAPGEAAYLFDLNKANSQPSRLLAGSARATQESNTKSSYNCTLKGPEGVNGIAQIYLPKEPRLIKIDGETVIGKWNKKSQTLLIHFKNSPKGKQLEIEW